MKKLVVLLVLALSSVQAFSQSVVKGRLLDSSTRVPEVGAVVEVFDGPVSGGKTVGYAVSDSLGRFSAKAKLSGEGAVRVMNLGRKTVELGISPAATVELGDILLEDDVQNLAGSTVTALKTLVRIDADKLTYDIEGDADSKTMTVLDMLRKIPMVTVDAQDNITVNGSSSFKVYVDGRPNQMLSANPSQMFKLMPASFIKSIEVIINPGAKYDAEGTGGVLDIKTKSGSGSKAVSDGLYGTVSAEVNSRGGVDGGLNLNAQKGKWTFGANINAGTDPFDGVIAESSQLNRATGVSNRTTYTGDADQRYLWGSLNASYEIDSLNLVTASLGGNSFSNDSYTRDGGFLSLSAVGDTLVNYSYDGSSRSSWNSLSGSLDYQHRFPGSSNKYLTFSYQFSGNFSGSDGTIKYGDAISNHSVSDDANFEHTFQADYTTPLWSDNHILSTGLKYIHRNNSANDVFNPGTAGETPSVYDYYNNIGAAYAEYSGTFGRFTAKGGVRFEQTLVKVDYQSNPAMNFGADYPVLVPNVSLQYNMGMASNVSLSYNMRIRRPGIHYLNPYVDSTSLGVISYGNTAIEAELSHQLQLSYNMASPKWVLSLRLVESFGDRGIGQYSFYDSAGLLNSTYGNIQQSSRTSLNAYVNWNASNKTRIYAFGDGGYEFYRNIEDGLTNGGWRVQGGFGAQHTLPWDLRISGNLFANSGGYDLQGWRSGMGFASLGLTKTFLDDRLSLSLRAQSNLGTGRLIFYNYSSSNGFVSENWQKIPIRSASFSISYTFGKKQGIQTKRTQRSISNDDLVGAGGGSTISSQVSGGM